MTARPTAIAFADEPWSGGFLATLVFAATPQGFQHGGSARATVGHGEGKKLRFARSANLFCFVCFVVLAASFVLKSWLDRGWHGS